ncbi:MAG: hypothetical protein JST78_06435, partial [Bacteroidetes bacterium]|nr:hypothetical protein [Bacteroidota bacterium]
VGVSAGSATMTYTVAGSGGCPNATATRTITVTAPVSAGTLSGTQNICIGDSVTFSSSVLGGTWTSSNSSIATINAATGAIVGVSAGSATMTYTVLGSGGCPNATATRTVTVTAPVSAGTLSGTQSICIGDSVTFSSSVLGGSWTSSNSSVATINAATGAIVGVSAGSATMTYTVLGSGGCPSASVTRTITVTAPVSAGTISGTQSICIGDSVIFSSSVLGGTWTSSNSSIATINAATGAIVGVSAGSATMTYTVLGSGGCPSASDVRTVNVSSILSPVINCGTSTTSSVQFTWTAVSGATGYNLSYQVNAGAVTNVGAIGNVTSYLFSSLSPGDVVSITLTPTGPAPSCFASSTLSCTANNCVLPTASIAYGGSPFCASLSSAQSVTLSGTGSFTGGTFSAPAGLSINSFSGDITPSSSTPGSYTVTYTILGTSGCPNVVVTTSVTITAPVSAGTLSGTQNICIGDSVTFSSSVLGGSWTSSNPAVATINAASGAIVGVSAGSATITYTVAGSGGCPSATATRTVTITAPVSAGTLSGTQNICIGDSVTFGSSVLGGTWTSSNPAVATINASTGAIVGVSAGSATMTYTVLGSGGCPNATATRTVTVTAPVSAGTLSGTQNICIGDSVTFGSSVLGGTWTSSNSSIATINAASGAIVGVSAGSATMTYTVLGSGGCRNATATRTITVTAPVSAGTISGTQSICIGDSVIFSSSVLGGSWTSSNPAVATINASTGAIVGVSAGSATMTYTVLGSGGCPSATATRTVTITAPVSAGTLSGTQNICIGDSVTFGSSVLGGTWTSSNPAVATINSASGAIVGVSSGSATMTYTVLGSGGCPSATATRTITLTAPVSAGTLSGTQNICIGDSVTFGSSVSGGTWTSSNPAVATINAATGAIVGVSAGSATMTYTVLGSGGCPNATATRTITVTAPVSAGTLSGTQNICIGDSVTFSSSVLGGAWTSFNSSIATITAATGAIVGVSAGSATMTYTVLGSGGCPNATATRTVTVTAPVSAGTLSGTQ